MTEAEKRDQGLLYKDGNDPEILGQLAKCKDICFELNMTKPSLHSERIKIIKGLFGKAKSIKAVHSPFWCDFGFNIEVGENFFANHGLVILDCAKVVFGDNVLIGPNCSFNAVSHPIDLKRRNEGYIFALPIKIGDDVWFGSGVQVMQGVTIGSNVVIGSGSVVTKDIPSGVVAVGNPCKVLRPISDKDKERMY